METPELKDLLPHKSPMILLDRVGELKDNGLETYVDISKDSMFFEEQGVPSYVGLEYMAQTVAAYAGFKALEKNEKVKEGFLLGTRDITFKQAYFKLNTSLKIKCSDFMSNQEMGVFDCEIILEETDESLGSCKLNVFQPVNPEEFFNTI